MELFEVKNNHLFQIKNALTSFRQSIFITSVL